MKKSISSAVSSFVKQKGYTPEQTKALSKLTALEKHRELVPMHHKSPEYVKQGSRLYKARVDVKKAFGAPGPVPKGPKAPTKPPAGSIGSSLPAGPKFSSFGTQTASAMTKPSVLSPAAGSKKMGFIGNAVDRFAAHIPENQRAPLSKLTALEKHRDLVPMHHKSPEYVKQSSRIYQAKNQLKKAAGLPGPVKKGSLGPAQALTASVKAHPPSTKEFKPFLGGALKPVHDKLGESIASTGGSHMGAVKAAAHGVHQEIKGMAGWSTAHKHEQDEFNKISKAHRAQYVQAEHDVMEYYSGSGYGTMNGYLRKGKVSKNWMDDESHGTVAGVKKNIAAMDKGLAKHPATKDLKLFRGVNGKSYFDGLKPGETFTEKGYSSTSAFHESSFKSKEVLMRIHVPKGYPAPIITSGISSEKEILLPRNTKFQVIKKKTIPGEYGEKKLMVHVRVIPHDEVPGIDKNLLKAKKKP